MSWPPDSGQDIPFCSVSVFVIQLPVVRSVGDIGHSCYLTLADIIKKP